MTSHPPASPNAAPSARLKGQLSAYLCWVNCQLRKKKNREDGAPLFVLDLEKDFRDGTKMAALLEIVSGGEKIEGVAVGPLLTPQQKRQNVERVLRFMNAKNMDVKNISPKEVSEGHLKSVMRMILAVARRYKPSSVVAPPVVASPAVAAYGSLDRRKRLPVSASGVVSLPRPPPSYRGLTVLPAPHTTSTLIRQTQPRTVRERPLVDEKEEGEWSATCPAFRSLMRGCDDGDYAGTDSEEEEEGGGRNAFHSDRRSVYSWSDGIRCLTSPTPSIRTVHQMPLHNTNAKMAEGLREAHPSQRAPHALSAAKSMPCLVPSDAAGPFTPLKDRAGYRDYENYPLCDVMAKPPDTKMVSASTAPSCGGRGALVGRSWSMASKGDGLLSSTAHSNPNRNPDVSRPSSTSVTSSDAMLKRVTSSTTPGIPFGGTSNEDKLVALQSYLQQTSEKCHELHCSLQKATREVATLKHAKGELEQHVCEQEKQLEELKEEVTKLRLANQSLEAEKEERNRTCEGKEMQLAEFKRQLTTKEKLFHQQKSQLDEAMKQLSQSNRCKVLMTSQLAEQDRKIALLEQARSHKTPMREELHVVREAFHSLRSTLKKNEPTQHTLDTLEQSFFLLMERLHVADMQKFCSVGMEGGVGKRLPLEGGWVDPRRCPLPPSAQVPMLDAPPANAVDTKVVYFTEKTLTPFMSSIPKRLGEIRLRDFKCMFDRPGNYRFHFKSMDPEYGMVKEEIMHDDDILPGWDGKIIAWVEEDP